MTCPERHVGLLLVGCWLKVPSDRIRSIKHLFAAWSRKVCERNRKDVDRKSVRHRRFPARVSSCTRKHCRFQLFPPGALHTYYYTVRSRAAKSISRFRRAFWQSSFVATETQHIDALDRPLDRACHTNDGPKKPVPAATDWHRNI